MIVACGAPVDRPEVGPAPVVRRTPFLLPPTSGYPATIDPALAERLERAYGDLMRGGMSAEALAVARQSQENADSAAPATVLAAQAYFIAGSCSGAVAELTGLVAEWPQFVAAQVLLGHCRENLGDLPGAASAYAAVASLNRLAEAQLAKIGRQARDAAVGRIRGWLAGEDIEAARAGLTDLKDWAPGDAESLIAVSELAAALGDRRLELEFIRALVGKAVPERAVLERQAQLELDVGNAGAGLAILQQLQLQHPEEPGIGASLERARFDWRLTMLPDSAQGLAASPELDRGQLAALLYWVFPRVRHSRPAKAIIASDVLDHPYRTEIVRVVNLGIMAIDPNLHAFRPHEAAQRGDALLGLLRVLERSRGALDCFGGSAVDADLSLESTCELAARCQLLDEPADCLPRATLPGSTAMNMARNATRQLEQE